MSSHSIQNFFEKSSYRMINVCSKPSTHRQALASGKIYINNDVLHMIKNKSLAKGDVIPLAEIAGINGAKSTATLLPLCHPLPIDHVTVKLEVNFQDRCVDAYCLVSSFAKTGVEMEAISGVQGALLCIYDLCKMYGHQMLISDVRLLYKEGGKSHKICFPESLPPELSFLAEKDPLKLEGISVAVISVSDRASQGVYEDKSGNLLKSELQKNGATVTAYEVVADDKDGLIETINQVINSNKPKIIFTTGGTGVGPRDITPEAIKVIIDFEVPGLAELLRSDGAKYTSFSWLSRSIVGMHNGVLIISFPGSIKAVTQGLNAVVSLLPHALNMIEGKGHD